MNIFFSEMNKLIMNNIVSTPIPFQSWYWMPVISFFFSRYIVLLLLLTFWRFLSAFWWRNESTSIVLVRYHPSHHRLAWPNLAYLLQASCPVRMVVSKICASFFVSVFLASELNKAPTAKFFFYSHYSFFQFSTII